MAFLYTSSGQEGTLEGLEDKTLEQRFDRTQELYGQNTKHPDDDLKNTSYPDFKNLSNWIHFDFDSVLYKEKNDWESEIL